MRRRHLILLLGSIAMGGGLFVHTLVNPNGLSRRQALQEEVEAIQAANLQAQGEVQRLRRQVEALRSSTKYQERVVRDELGFVRPGDVIVEVESIPTP